MRFFILSLTAILLAGCPVALAASLPGDPDDGKAETVIEEEQAPPPEPVSEDDYDVESGTRTQENSGEDEVIVRKIREADMLYAQAIDRYDTGDYPGAEQCYRQMIRNLAVLDAGACYRLKQEFNTIFTKLGRLLDGDEEKAGQGTCPLFLDTDDALVQKYLRSYADEDRRQGFREVLERSGKYRDMILQVLKEYDLPAELLYLPFIESSYDLNDVSSAGAVGIWQLMPERARALGLKVNYWIDERRDPEKSTRAAARYLQELYQLFDDWYLALAAYNRGEYGLGRDLQKANVVSIRGMREKQAVPKETQCFVPRFIAAALIGKEPGKYEIPAVEYDSPVRYERVYIDTAVDLKVVARCAGASLEDIRALNPAIKAWCTPPHYPRFELHLPPGSRQRFLANIAVAKDLNPGQGYIKYRVQQGDCLVRIARRFHTTVNALRTDNHLKEKGGILQVNNVLLIRPGRKLMD
jgi:membrane-bound lytic murein transglycosylase D